MKLFALVMCCVLYSEAAPAEDEVTSMPGLSKSPSFKHYSGYLKASGTKHLHYWFVESENNPSKDPVVLWLNGGPGCSSVLGLLTEHGPFRISKTGKGVSYNDWSWNRVANMLYLEAPAGVGFSYADDKKYATNDDQVASDNYLALKDFFSKFPEFSSNEFYVTGESYGGIYVPTLSAKIVNDSSFNFQGMAIGNGITNFDMNDDSLLYFAYYHGLIGDRQWNETLSACCPGPYVQRCPFVKHYSELDDSKCSAQVQQLLGIIYEGGLNEYNLYAPCVQPKLRGFVYNNDSFIYHLPSLGHRKHPHMQHNINRIKQKRQFQESVRVTPPCLDYGYVISYLNNQAVRKALHISVFSPDWDVCSDAVGASYQVIYHDVTQFYRKVLNAGKRVLVYNGDVDMACNFLGDEWFVEALDLPVVSERKAWYVADAAGNEQVAGFTKKFKQLKLTTVRGSGHMVPQDKPHAAFVMFSDFLNNK